MKKIVIQLQHDTKSYIEDILNILKTEGFELETDYSDVDMLVGYIWHGKIDKVTNKYDFIDCIAIK